MSTRTYTPIETMSPSDILAEIAMIEIRYLQVASTPRDVFARYIELTKTKAARDAWLASKD